MTAVFRCFQKENFGLVTQTALAVRDHRFFLATHAPVKLAHLDRKWQRLPEDPTRPFGEEDLLEIFRTADPSKVTFALVRGSTGSGKSHLIRWLHTRLAADQIPNTKLLLIRRDETNLREIIRQIVNLAGDDPGQTLAEIRERLAKAQEQLNEVGKRNLLLDELARAVDPANYPKGTFDPYAGLTDKNELSARKTVVKYLPAFIRHEMYRTHFVADGGVIDDLVRLTVGERKGDQFRDHPREFTATDFDLPDNLVFAAGTDTASSASKLAQFLKQNPPMRQQAAAYVNSRLKPCTDRLLNLEGVSLLEVFTEVRRRLRLADQRLILLIEDIADVEYMHRQVLEALIADPKDDLCPLASAVGVSDGFSAAIPDNVRDRAFPYLYTLDVTHASLDEYTRHFAARYLNALRTPAEALAGARSDQPLPSACQSCRFNEGRECHTAFGAVEGTAAAVGLFPFNTRALEVMSEKIREKSGLDFNPRRFLYEVLLPTVEAEAASFADGKYPPKILRDRFISSALSPAVVATLNTKFGRGRGEQAEALHKIWGENLPAGVYQVFGLTAPPTVTPEPPVPPLPPPIPESPSIPPPPAPAPNLERTGDTPITGADADRLRTALDELDTYHSGGKVGSKTLTLLRAVVKSAVLSRIDWNRLFMDEGDWDGPGDFPDEAVNLEADGMPGQLGGQAAQRLSVPRQFPDRPELAPSVGLQGLLLAHHFDGWKFTYATQPGWYYLRHAAPLVERLADQAAARLVKDFAPAGSDLPAAGLELLAVAARLQGGLVPGATDADVIRELFNERTFVRLAADNNRSWDALLHAFEQHFKDLRERVLNAVNCAKGDSRSYLLDAGRILAAITRWAGRNGKAAELIPNNPHPYWAKLKVLRLAVDQHLAAAVKDEAETWIEWVRDVDAQLDGQEPHALLEQGELFRSEVGLRFRCTFSDEQLARLGKRSPFLAGLRNQTMRQVSADQLRLRAEKFEQVIRAEQAAGGDAPTAGPFAGALAAARAVRLAWEKSPQALDQVLPLLASCRAESRWLAARIAWWDYTLVLADAVRQTRATLKGVAGPDGSLGRGKARKILVQIDADARAIREALQ